MGAKERYVYSVLRRAVETAEDVDVKVEAVWAEASLRMSQQQIGRGCSLFAQAAALASPGSPVHCAYAMALAQQAHRAQARVEELAALEQRLSESLSLIAKGHFTSYSGLRIPILQQAQRNSEVAAELQALRIKLQRRSVGARAAVARAETEFRVAHDLAPSNPRALVCLAELHSMLVSPRNYTAAELCLQEALRCSPESSRALGAYGMLLWERDRAEGPATDLLTKALQLEPTDIKALCGYASVLKGTERRSEALQVLNRAVKASVGGPLELYVAQEAHCF